MSEYRTIVIDPPWPIKKIRRTKYNWKSDAAMDYPVMTIPQIAAFPITTFMHQDGAHLFMWTTNRFLWVARRIVRKWGGRVIVTMVWNKRTKNGHGEGMKPHNLHKFNVEFCLYGRIGNPGQLPGTVGLWQGFDGVRREHSRKPEEFYEMIRPCTPEPRIDIFARETHEGFSKWGNETDRFEGGTAVLRRANQTVLDLS